MAITVQSSIVSFIVPENCLNLFNFTLKSLSLWKFILQPK